MRNEKQVSLFRSNKIREFDVGGNAVSHETCEKSQSNKDLNLGDENRTVTIGQSKKRRKEDYSRVFGTLDARN